MQNDDLHVFSFRKIRATGQNQPWKSLQYRNLIRMDLQKRDVEIEQVRHAQC